MCSFVCTLHGHIWLMVVRDINMLRAKSIMHGAQHRAYILRSVCIPSYKLRVAYVLTLMCLCVMHTNTELLCSIVEVSSHIAWCFSAIDVFNMNVLLLFVACVPFWMNVCDFPHKIFHTEEIFALSRMKYEKCNLPHASNEFFSAHMNS